MIKVGVILFLVSLVVGVYFINSSFGFVVLPDFILDLNKWIILVGGVLILFGGIKYLGAGKGSGASSAFSINPLK